MKKYVYLLVLLVLSTSIEVNAATITWTNNNGTGDNSWDTPSNWSGGVIPTSGDDVIFDNTHVDDCSVDASGSQTVNSITFNSGYTGTLYWNADASFTVSSALTINEGTIDLSTISTGIVQFGSITVAGSNAAFISSSGSQFSSPGSFSISAGTADFSASTGATLFGLNITGGTFTSGQTISITGDLTLSGSGVFNANSGTITVNMGSTNNTTRTITGSFVFHNFGTSFTTGSSSHNRTLTLANDITVQGQLKFAFAGAGNSKTLTINSSSQTINLTDDGSSAGATVTTTQSGGTISAINLNATVNFNSTYSQSIYFNATHNLKYKGINCNNTNASGVSLSAAVTTTNVTGNIAVQTGTLSNNSSSGYAMNGSGTLTVSSGATLKLFATSAFPTGFTTTLSSGSTVEYAGTSQTISGTPTYHHLTLSAASGTPTKTLGATTVVNGDLAIGSSTTLDAAGFQLTLGGAFANSGSFTHNSNTTIFNNSTTVSGSATTTFNNITISGTLIAPSGTMNIAGNFANNGTFTHSSGTIVFTSNSTISGSSTTTFNNVTISGTLVGASAANVNIAGNFVNNGTFTHNSGTITFTGTTALSGSTSNPTFAFSAVTISGTLTSASTITVAGDFTNNGTFTHNSGTITFNGTTTVSGSSTTTFKNVTISGTLTGHSTNMNVAGAWTQNGTFTHNSGKVTFNGATSQSITGSNSTTFYDLAGATNSTAISCDKDVNLVNSLSMSNGATLDFDGSAGTSVFTFKSTSNSATARINDLTGWTGSFSGNATFQRYVLGSGAGTDVAGWMLVNAPLATTTFSSFDDDMVLACDDCPDGSVTNFYSMYSFSTAANDFSAITSVGTTMTNGQGYMIWAQENASTAGDITLDVTGNAVVGNVTAPKYTLSSAGSGYNLVGNPYQSPISWNNVRSGVTSLDNTMWVYNADYNGGDYVQYDGTTSTPAVGSNGIGDDIPAWQGFFVLYTGGGTDLTFNENDKSTTNNAFLRVGHSKTTDKTFAATPIIRLGAEGQGYKTETVFSQLPAASNGADSYDSKKLFPYGFNPNALAIYSKADTLDCAINYVSNTISNSLYIPVRLRAGVVGSYTINVTEFSNFSSNACLKLLDKVTGLSYDVNASTSFTINVTDTTDIERFALYVPGSFTSASVTNPPVCSGISGTMVAIPAAEALAPYTFTWKDNNGNVIRTETRNTADTLMAVAGDYTVEIADIGYTCSNFTSTQSYTISNPAPDSISSITTVPSCNGAANAYLVATPSGHAPWSYIWKDSNGNPIKTVTSISTTDTLMNVAAGDYSVEINFDLGCNMITKNYTVSQPALNTMSSIETAPVCNGSSTGYLISTPDANGPWTYTWKDTNGNTIKTNTSAFADTLMNVAAGDYSVSVSFADGCTPITKSFTLTEPGVNTMTVSDKAPICNGGNNGYLTALPDANGPWTYTWKDNNGNPIKTVTSAVADTLNNLAAGDYSVDISFAAGCTPISKSFTLTQPNAATLAYSSADISCNAANNGKIVAKPSAYAPWIFNWKDKNNNVIKAVSSSKADSVINLAPGNYSVSIVLSSGCGILTQQYTITEPAANAATSTFSNISCNASATGLAVATGTTNGPWNYTWKDTNGNTIQTTTNVSGSDSLKNITAGDYSVMISFNNSCNTITKNYTISEPAATVANFTQSADTLYYKTGTTVVFTNASTGALTYSWNFGDGKTSTLANPSHSYSLPGTYTVTLTVDNANCSTSSSYSKTVVVINNVIGIAENNNNDHATIYSNNNSVFVQFNFTDVTDAVIHVQNMLGQFIATSESVKAHKQTIKLDLTNFATQVMIVTIETKSEKITKRIAIY